MKSKGVTTQMEALNQYFLMVMFTSLLNRIHVFAIFVLNYSAVYPFFSLQCRKLALLRR